MALLGMLFMNRGDVYWVNFDSAIGSEITKKRPAVIISNNLSNLYSSRLQVMPLTSNINKVYPCEAIVHIRDKQGKAMADQITTVDKSRIGNLMGALSASDMKNVDKVVKLQLDLL